MSRQEARRRLLDAAEEADSAARRAGVEVRPVADLEGFAAVRALFDTTWSGEPTNPTVTVEILRALSKSGGYVVGAFDGVEMLGATVAFFGAPDERALHSHVTGVSAAARGRSVGFALKLFQRLWALERGIDSIYWTFDPLVRRNAYFNIAKLGARPVEYLTNFYGSMHDAINRDGASDRLLVRWDLLAGEPVTGGAGPPPGSAHEVLSVSPRGLPLRSESDAEVVFVGIPADIEALRTDDAALASEWRVAVREALDGLFREGARVTGFDDRGRYIVDRRTPENEMRSTYEY